MKVPSSGGKPSTGMEAAFPLIYHWVYQKDRHALQPRGQVVLQVEEKNPLFSESVMI